MTADTSTATTGRRASRHTRAVARITELWLFPVKSMAGTRVDRRRRDAAAGLAGDRSWAVVDESGGDA